MFILDKPYLSDLLIETINRNGYPVLYNDILEGRIENFKQDCDLSALNKLDYPKIYANSENAFNKIFSCLNKTKTVELVKLFKDKARCRELLSSIYPEFYFKKLSYDELFQIDPKSLKYPSVIKPAIGFLSFGVYYLGSKEDFLTAIDKIKASKEAMNSYFPPEVLNTDNFIIEEFIEGDEYAVDLYFDDSSNPCILNIFKHPFLSKDDVSDRIYITSVDIIKENYKTFFSLFKKIGTLTGVKNFPMHIELRKNGDIAMPVEINPLRFAGWCTTDIAYYAYGINVYEYYYQNKIPNWEKISKEKGNKACAFIMLEVPDDIDKNNIDYFDIQKFLSHIKVKPLEIRQFDFKFNPIFCELFVSFNSFKLVEEILRLDIKNYIVFKDK